MIPAWSMPDPFLMVAGKRKLISFKFVLHQEIADRKIHFLVDIPGFVGADLKHERFVADTVASFEQVLSGRECSG